MAAKEVKIKGSLLSPTNIMGQQIEKVNQLKLFLGPSCRWI